KIKIHQRLNRMINSGWVKLYRKLMDNPIWLEERFTKGQAWVDLIMLSNFESRIIVCDGEKTVIERGQVFTSIVKLAKRWKWDRKTVSKYLFFLEKERMIKKESDNKKTVITIINYSNFQGEKSRNKFNNFHQRDYDFNYLENQLLGEGNERKENT